METTCVREFAFLVCKGSNVLSLQTFPAIDEFAAKKIALQMALDDFLKYALFGAESFVVWDVDCDRLVDTVPFR